MSDEDTDAPGEAHPLDPADEALIEARGLWRMHAEGGKMRPVLSEVDLRVAPKTFVAVMGPSGSGKSTLLHLLGALDAPSNGEIWLDGHKLEALSEEERTTLRRDLVGFVFQFFNLVPNLSVAENVALPLALQGVKKPRQDERFRSVVEFFGIEDKLERRPHELSGGEMQRTSIARALVHQPRVVLADEPTGNLASAAGREVMQFLRRAVDELDQTVLLVTHNPRDAAFADEVYFLQDGRLDSTLALRGEEIHEDRITARMEELGI